MLKCPFHVGSVKNYIIDGGPTNKHPQLFSGLIAYLTEHARTAKGEFSLAGIVVTHPDHDHIEGVLKLLQEFPPNQTPGGESAKFIFQGPLLVTEYFNSNPQGVELINTLKSSNFSGTEVENPSDAGFKSNFQFHFCPDEHESYNGLAFNHTPSSYCDDIKSFALEAIAKVPARNTVDDSKANLSSIITVWKDPTATDPKDIQAVFTGDSVGYRVLKVVKGKSLKFFQVPHHGSARNSLPLAKNVLPNKAAITLVQQLSAFKVLLAYELDRANWNSIVAMEIGEGVASFNRREFNVKNSITFEGVISYIAPEVVNSLNSNSSIELPSSYTKSKAQYCYEQAVSALNAVENNISSYNNPTGDMSTIFNFPNQAFFGSSRKRLYTTTLKQAQTALDVKVGVLSASHLVYACNVILFQKNNRLLDQVTSLQVSQFYSSFQAKIYYISTVHWQHGHPSPDPHQGLLDGLIQAAVAQRNNCILLLASGNVLNFRRLPNAIPWNKYVQIQYFSESGNASIDSSSGMTVNAEVYKPSSTTSDVLKNIGTQLDRGSTAQYYRKRKRDDDNYFEVTTSYKDSSGNTVQSFLFVKPNSTFGLQQSSVVVYASFGTNASGDTFISVVNDSHSAK